MTSKPSVEHDVVNHHRPPPKLTPVEKWTQAAQRGDVDHFLDILRTQHDGLIRVGDMLRYLLQAIEVRCQADPEGFARDQFGRMVAFNSFLTLRAQLLLSGHIMGGGPTSNSATIPDLTLDVIERLLPRLIEMQQATAGLLVAQAQSQRLWGLTRAKETRGERATPADGRGKSLGNPANEVESAVADAPYTKEKAASEEVVSLPVRGRRRG